MSTKVSVILAAGLLMVAFGVGLGVGRSTPQRRVAGAMQSAKAQRHAGAVRELAACQEELDARTTPPASSSAANMLTDEAQRAIATEEAKLEVLEKELRQCKKREMFFNVDLCRAADRYIFPLFLVALHADKQCVDKFGVGDLVLKHSKQCTEFEDQREPEELDIGELSDTELGNLYRAQQFGRRSDLPGGDRIANLTRYMKRTIRECHVKFGLSDD